MQSAGGEIAFVYSLGNFVFDQSRADATGALLEVRFFDQGTFFSRIIRIPNFYSNAVGLPNKRRQ